MTNKATARMVSRSDVLLSDDVPPLTKEEFKAWYIRLTPTQQAKVQQELLRTVAAREAKET